MSLPLTIIRDLRRGAPVTISPPNSIGQRHIKGPHWYVLLYADDHVECGTTRGPRSPWWKWQRRWIARLIRHRLKNAPEQAAPARSHQTP
jgi:hypothetical protein